MKELFNKKLFKKPAYISNKKRDIVYTKVSFNVKVKKHFSGNSPPEIFVGRYNYPNINAGILAPNFYENTEEMAMPEIWHEKNFSIADILTKRSQLIYGRFKTQIKKQNSKLKDLMQEIARAYKPVSTEFFLKKPPKQNFEINMHSPIITNLAPLDFAKLQENPKVKQKVEYLTSDTDSKSVTAINELYKSSIPVSNINKILSAGLLGLKTQRKLVPTRWSITAVDDTISKELLKKIRYYPEINEVLLFNSEYNGNHYEILLLPDKFSFEIIEIETNKQEVWQDYEFFHGRKNYASNVVGGYYVARLALTEYLESIKHQATAFFMREVRPEYYAPLGVGILRQCTRDAFSKKPEKFNTIQEALERAQTRMNLPTSTFTDKSIILKEYGKQTRLNRWF
ncbi:MAG: hypothetical protein ABIH37_00575 [archaeon]